MHLGNTGPEAFLFNAAGNLKAYGRDPVIEQFPEQFRPTESRVAEGKVKSVGKFSVNEKKPRRGRNPATGNDLMLDARRVVTFYCSGVLKDRLNQK